MLTNWFTYFLGWLFIQLKNVREHHERISRFSSMRFTKTLIRKMFAPLFPISCLVDWQKRSCISSIHKYLSAVQPNSLWFTLWQSKCTWAKFVFYELLPLFSVASLQYEILCIKKNNPEEYEFSWVYIAKADLTFIKNLEVLIAMTDMYHCHSTASRYFETRTTKLYPRTYHEVAG